MIPVYIQKHIRGMHLRVNVDLDLHARYVLPSGDVSHLRVDVLPGS